MYKAIKGRDTILNLFTELIKLLVREAPVWTDAPGGAWERDLDDQRAYHHATIPRSIGVVDVVFEDFIGETL